MIISASTSGVEGPILLRLELCTSFKDKFFGLMGRPSIPTDGGILLQDSTESIVNASIHMFFMKFDLAVFWLDKDLFVVDKVMARKWKPYYAPAVPARFTIEAHPSQYEKISIGSKFSFLH